MGKKSKFPMFFEHKRGEGSTSLHKHRGLIIGDLEKVIDLKTQYLIETFNLDFATGDLDSIKNIKELTYAEVSAEDDGYTDYLFYPLLEKNKKNPTAFLCLHLYTCPYLDEKGIGNNSLIEKYVKKKYLIKKININCGKICFFPLANDLKNKPFVTKIFDNFNLNLISPGKNRIEVIKQIRKIRECGLEEAKKITEKLPSLIKSWKETPTFTFWDRKRVRDIRDELIKCGAKVELINKNVKPFEQYDLKDKFFKAMEKELKKISTQKNKRNIMGQAMKSNVENGIYDVYNPVIRVADDEYEGKKYPQYNSFIFVIKR